MTSALNTAANLGVTIIELLTPTNTVQLLNGIIALFIFLALVTAAFFSTYFFFVAVIGYYTRYRPRVVTNTNGPPLILPFQDQELLLPLTIAFTGAVSAFVGIASVFGGAAKQLLQFIVQNLALLIVIIIQVVLVTLALKFYVQAIVANFITLTCFVYPIFVRPLMLFTSSAALIFTVPIPIAAVLSHISKAASTGALLRAITCALPAVKNALVLLATAIAKLLLAVGVFLGPNKFTPGATPNSFFVGPDFTQSGVLLGQSVFQLEAVLKCSCETVDPFLFAPIAVPFKEPAFAQTINQTLSLPFVFVFQGVLQPLVGSVQRRHANPTGSFGSIFSRPSLNSTFDTAGFALGNATQFVDSFLPAFFSAYLTTISGLVGFTLPTNPIPQRGFYTLLSTPIALLIPTAKITFNLILNLDIAVTTTNGFLLWRYDEVFDKEQDLINVLTSNLDFIVSFIQATVPFIEKDLAIGLPAHQIITLNVGNVGRPQVKKLDTLGKVIGVGIQLVASLINVVPCFVKSLNTAVIHGTQLGLNLLVGSIYTSVSVGIQTGKFKPLLFAQEQFGDVPEQESCMIQIPGGNNVEALTAFTYSCADKAALGNVCAILANGTLPSTLPTAISITASNSELNSIESICLTAPGSCSFVIEQPNGTAAHLTPAPDQFDIVMNEFVQPFVCIASLFDAFCPQSASGQAPTDCLTTTAFVSSLGKATVSVIDNVLNIVLHVDTIFTSNYLGEPTCVLWDNSIDQVQLAFFDISNLLRQANALSTGDTTACPLIVNVADPSTFVPPISTSFFCCLANFVDAGVALVSSLLRQVVSLFQFLVNAVVSVANGGAGSDLVGILNSITLQPTFAAAGQAVSSVLCIPVQAIPSGATCALDGSNFRKTALSTLSTATTDVVILVPEVLFNGATSLLSLITSLVTTGQLPDGGVQNFIHAVFSPVIATGGQLFVSLGTIFSCLDNAASGLGNAFIQIGNFLVSIGNTAIDVITTAVQGALEILVGIFQIITGSGTVAADFNLIVDGISLLTEDFFKVLIAIFSEDFVCGVTDGLCFFSVDFAPPIKACLTSNPPYSFTFCSSQPGRPSGILCSDDDTNCVFGDSIGPHFCSGTPFGCCGNSDFPADGTDASGLVDSRDHCDWQGVPDGQNNCNSGDPSCIFRDTSKFNQGNLSDAAFAQELQQQFGQINYGTSCPVFRDNTQCDKSKQVFLDPVTGAVTTDRKRSIYTSDRNPNRFATAQSCMTYVETYGVGKARQLFEDTRLTDAKSLDQADYSAYSCYRSLIWDTDTRRKSVHEHERKLQFTNVFERTKGAMTKHFGSQLQDIVTQGSALFEAQKTQTLSVDSLPDHQFFPRWNGAGVGSLVHGFYLAFSRQDPTIVPAIASLLDRPRVRSVRRKRSESSPQHSWSVQLSAAARHLKHVIGHFSTSLNKFTDMRTEKKRSLVEVADDHHAERRRKRSLTSGLHHDSGGEHPMIELLTDHANGIRERVGNAALKKIDYLHDLWYETKAMREKNAANPDFTQQLSFTMLGRAFDHATPGSLAAMVKPPPPNRFTTPQQLFDSVSNAVTLGENPQLFAVGAIGFDPSMLPELGYPDCDPTQQIICTTCLYFNDLVFATQEGLDSLGVFFDPENTDPNSMSGFITQFGEVILTNVDYPLSDTFTTENKVVPWIGNRFIGFDWPTRWNYDILFNALTGDSTNNPPQSCFVDIFASLNLDPTTTQGLRNVFGDAINILEQIICRFIVAPGESVGRLFDTFIVCDYKGAVFCHGDIGVGLFTGLVLIILLLGVLALLLMEVPMGMMLLMMIAGPVFMFGVPWVAYGTPPTCLLPSVYTGLPAYPACILMDANTLLNEFFSNCPPYPIGLIKASAFAEASVTPCSVCTFDPPELGTCAEQAGFDTFLDNVFYSIGVLEFPNGTVNAFIASTIGSISDDVRTAALKYTPQHVQDLEVNSIGAICNALTFAGIIVGYFLLLLKIPLSTAILLGVAALLYPAALFLNGVFLLIEKVISHVDDGFTKDDRVAPETKPPSKLE